MTLVEATRPVRMMQCRMLQERMIADPQQQLVPRFYWIVANLGPFDDGEGE